MLSRNLSRLIDALTDAARRERMAVAVLFAYAVIWALYGIIAKSSQDMNYDAAELVEWSHHPAFGYTKHPPFGPWLAHAWFTLFPVRDWSNYLLAMSYVALGLWFAWRLFESYLDPQKRIVALACLMLVPYYNFLSLRFDHNAVLGPLWAAATWCFARSFETRRPLWAALAGVAAAAAMLGKYWSIFLLAGLAIAALADPRRASYFRSSAPWITIAVGALALAPHLLWLVQHDFIPMTYAVGAHNATSLGDSLKTAGGYLAGAVGYAAVPVLLVLALARPNGAALADILWPRTAERRFAAVAFWATLVLPAVVGPVFGFELNPIWTTCGFILLPVVLLSSPLLTLSRPALTLIVAVAVLLPPVMLVASPGIALAIHIAGVKPVQADASLLARRVEQEWRRATTKPLRIVAGDLDLSNVTAYYLPGRPSSLAVQEPENAPWVTPQDIARDGAVIMCYANPAAHDCYPQTRALIDKLTAASPPTRRVEVTITRTYWGIAGKPGHYLLMIVPPRS